MPDIAAQLQALWKNIDVVKLLFDPEFLPTLGKLIELLRRNQKEPIGAQRRK